MKQSSSCKLRHSTIDIRHQTPWLTKRVNTQPSLLTNALFLFYCISKFTATKTNLNVIYVTEAYLHKKFIYNLFKLQSHFIAAALAQEDNNGMLFSDLLLPLIHSARLHARSHWVWFLWILIKWLGCSALLNWLFSVCEIEIDIHFWV